MKRKRHNSRRNVLPKVEGYCRIGGRYIAKGILLTALAAVLAAGLIYTTALHEPVMRLWYARQTLPELSLDSPWLAGYTGQARLMLADGSMVYEGQIVNGMVEGVGTVFHGGAAVYRGEFAEGQFSGAGRLYTGGGRLVYEGNFAENLYEGTGVLYGADGTTYTGGFAAGVFQGEGVQSIPRDGAIYTYVGAFTGGEREGFGRLYREGALIYEGNFSGGVFSGKGTLYEGGLPVYQGEFEHGVFSGQGKLRADGLLYTGGFADGLYDGEGRLYLDGALLYEGEFWGGQYNGQGIEYSPETGFKRFDGRYKSGERMKAGIEFDEDGKPIAEPVPEEEWPDIQTLSYEELLAALAEAERLGVPPEGCSFVFDAENGGLLVLALTEWK